MTVNSTSVPPSTWQTALLKRHGLGAAYLEAALKWFAPLAQSLAEHHHGASRPILVAINGCQGSGKTTLGDYLCAALAAEHDLTAVALSLDDFYLTRTERDALASTVHPLLSTRGVPGTHDIALLADTLTRLLVPGSPEEVAIPRFDKSLDDRRPLSDWDSVPSPVQVVLLEGWCLGAVPESADALSMPLNELEINEDPEGRWREYSNGVLERDFLPLYQVIDQWVMLAAPSFDCVYEWRREQEQKLAVSLSSSEAVGLMNDEQLRRFIQHYERITRACLQQLPSRSNHLFRLDEQRKILSYSQPSSTGESG